MRLLPILALAVLGSVGPVGAQGSLEERIWESLPPVSTIERLESFIDSLTARGRDPGWVGISYNPDTDPEAERLTVYAFRPDSTVWVQAPDGPSVVLDLFVATKLGEIAGARSGYGEAPAEGFGHGFRDGKMYIYLSQRVDVALAIGAGLAGLVLLVAGLVWALRRSRRRERAVVVSRQQMGEAREAERLRIARDIHDGPVQDLHAVRLRLDRTPDASLGDAVMSVIDGLRAISEDLRPPALDSMGVEPAIESFLGQIETAHPQVRLDFESRDGPPRLSPATSLAVFRVVQEAVNNAANHGSPGLITVRTERALQDYRVTVEDDGVGFDVPDSFTAYGRAGHYGLIGMSERAESVGGRIEVSRRAGGGTRVAVSVPQDPVQND